MLILTTLYPIHYMIFPFCSYFIKAVILSDPMGTVNFTNLSFSWDTKTSHWMDGILFSFQRHSSKHVYQQQYLVNFPWVYKFPTHPGSPSPSINSYMMNVPCCNWDNNKSQWCLDFCSTYYAMTRPYMVTSTVITTSRVNIIRKWSILHLMIATGCWNKSFSVACGHGCANGWKISMLH